MTIDINQDKNGNTMTSMGRKKKNPRDKKSIAIKIMVSPKERDEVEAAAAADDMETSTWMRRKILEMIRQKAK